MGRPRKRKRGRGVGGASGGCASSSPKLDKLDKLNEKKARAAAAVAATAAAAAGARPDYGMPATAADRAAATNTPFPGTLARTYPLPYIPSVPFCSTLFVRACVCAWGNCAWGDFVASTLDIVPPVVTLS